MKDYTNDQNNPNTEDTSTPKDTESLVAIKWQDKIVNDNILQMKHHMEIADFNSSSS